MAPLRAIASVTGTSHPTVIEDLKAGGQDLPPADPQPVTGRDGKTYTANQVTCQEDLIPSAEA